MGLKASLIIIQQPSATIPEEELLQKLGFAGFTYSGETTLEACMYPCDNSMSFGHYNNCLIIADDYQLTTSLERVKNPRQLSSYEMILSGLYPGSEILMIACHSVVSYDMFSLVKNGEKLRYKKMAADEQDVEYGQRVKEEHTEGIRGEFIAFDVAKRHLGVTISTGVDDDEIMFEIPFKKYISAKKEKLSEEAKPKGNWLSRLFK